VSWTGAWLEGTRGSPSIPEKALDSSCVLLLYDTWTIGVRSIA
jgi:hypothetical protein